MKFRYLRNFFLLSIIVFNFSSTCSFIFTLSTAKDIAKYGYDGIKALMDLKKAHNDRMWKQKVTESLAEIVNSTRRIESLLTEEADRVIEELSVKIDMQAVHDFTRVVHSINERFEKKFIKYFVEDNSYQVETIQSFINETISESGFQRILHSLNSYIIPRNYLNHVPDKRLFDILLDYQKIKMNHHRDCNEGSSHHQHLFAVYNLAVHTLVRGYTMVVHAYKYRQLAQPNPNAWNSEINDAVNEFKEALMQIAPIARRAMNEASKEIRRCDPNELVEGSNYISLKNFLSIILTTQTSMSSDFSCTGSCSSYKKLGSIFTNKNRLSQFQCTGSAYNCWKTSVTQICLANPGSGRRFEALTENYGLFNLYEHHRRGIWSERCYKEKISAFDFINNDPLCNICACTCDEWANSESIRSFSLREQYTDFRDGRIVTGIRVKVVDKVIHLEIQEGKLVNGSIDPSTVMWNPNASYLPQRGSEVVQLNYNMRSVNLDNIVLPPGYAVTGVRFALLRNRITLVVAGTQIFDEAGEIITPTYMQWYWPNQLPRTELELVQADIPDRENKVNVEVSQPGEQFVKFQLTDWNKDASQTLVPYIDSQAIFSDPPIPIGGVGIFYKNYNGSGGFLSLKLSAADYSIHVNETNLSQMFSDN
ncbi:uncharacterized protein [Chelonus insularis]|uniref:uncharacterized protein n=1 Tax=Chelonus insularis TaxID=460826 RepID=UPI00158F299A|nr:uncharacterized protein LOC118068317 [Chelonus insularis]